MSHEVIVTVNHDGPNKGIDVYSSAPRFFAPDEKHFPSFSEAIKKTRRLGRIFDFLGGIGAGSAAMNGYIIFESIIYSIDHNTPLNFQTEISPLINVAFGLFLGVLSRFPAKDSHETTQAVIEASMLEISPYRKIF